MRKRTLILLVVFTCLLGKAEAQKGEKSIAAGPLISFPLGFETGTTDFKTGLGAEIIGQYNFSEKSALLLKMTLASWGIKDGAFGYETNRLNFLTLQGGYNYQFGTSGFFINGLVGVDIDLYDSYGSACFTLGVGRRFMVKNDRFVDVGVDLIGADAEERLNIKVVFSLFRRLAKQ